MSAAIAKKPIYLFVSIMFAIFIVFSLIGCGEQTASPNAASATNRLQETVAAQQTVIAHLQRPTVRPNGFATVLAKETQAARANGFATVLAQETREAQSQQTMAPPTPAKVSPTVATISSTPVPTQAPTSRRMIWSRLISVPTMGMLSAIACPSVTICHAVDTTRGESLGTMDGGHTWSSEITWNGVISHTSGIPLMGVQCPSTSTCYVYPQDSLIFWMTTDGGMVWSKRDGFEGSINPHDMACPNSTTCFVWTGNAIMATTDGGKIWDQQLILPQPLFPGGIACPSVNTCYALASYALASDSRGGGLFAMNAGAWHKQSSVFPPANVNLTTIACPNGNTCYAVGYQFTRDYKSIIGVIFATEDGGRTWRIRASVATSRSLMGVACPSVSVCYAVGAKGTIMATTNGGSTWTRQSSGTKSNLWDIACPSVSTCYTAGDSGIILIGSHTPFVATPPSGSPTQLAEGFFQTMLGHNIDAARPYYAPDMQPNSWEQILGYVKGGYHSNTGKFDHIVPAVDECQGANYTVTERHAQVLGVPIAYVTLTFNKRCIFAPTGPFDSTIQTENQFAVTFERSTGHWYIDTVHLIPGA